jgi:DNA-binding transcriptional MerR regulator
MAEQSSSVVALTPELRIGDLARRTGIGKATIEHYLRLGLLQPSAVGEQGYRLFAADAIARLAVVRTGRRAGFTLPELRAALELVDPSTLEALLTSASPAQCRADLARRGVAIDA